MFKSRNSHRFQQNPLEKRFVDTWIEQNKYGHTLSHILNGPSLYGLHTPAVTSDHDEEVATTVIQWLGSPVGQAFLEDVLRIDDLREQIRIVLNDEEKGHDN